ncbi:MAG: hypothetical protein AB8G96_14790 [Phycisphaerales bacterium]
MNQRTVRSRRPARRAFTLIETALATVIVGVGVLAMVTAQTSFLRQNAWSNRASVAERLGNEIRELALNLPQRDPVTGAENWGPETSELDFDDYDDLDDFDGDGSGTIFSAELGNGPVDAQRRIIPNMDGWAQVIQVFNVSGTNIAEGPGEQTDGATNMMVIRVTVTYQGPNDDSEQIMTTVQWVAPE